MTLYIFVGPKKTGTSSVYAHLKKNCDLENFTLLPKESNILLKNVYTQDQMNRHLIDISPEYFSSYRAIFHASMIPTYQDVKIIILRRELDKKFVSYFDYMIKKGEISEKNLSFEFEKLFLQDHFSFFTHTWQKLPHSVFTFELGSSAFFEFLENEFNISGELPRDNEGRFRTTRLFKLMKWLASALRHLGLSKQVERLAGSRALRRLAYETVSEDPSGSRAFKDRVLDLRQLIKGNPES